MTVSWEGLRRKRTPKRQSLPGRRPRRPWAERSGHLAGLALLDVESLEDEVAVLPGLAGLLVDALASAEVAGDLDAVTLADEALAGELFGVEDVDPAGALLLSVLVVDGDTEAHGGAGRYRDRFLDHVIDDGIVEVGDIRARLEVEGLGIVPDVAVDRDRGGGGFRRGGAGHVLSPFEFVGSQVLHPA